MRTHDLAQLNIAKLLFPLESIELKGFVDNLDRINALAESSDGFVWRLIGESGNTIQNHLFGVDAIVNMSTWTDVKSLHSFVYRTAHTEVLKRRQEWFSELQNHSVMWWVPTGTTPTLAEAHRRLKTLEEKGPTADAFVFSQLYDPT